jgi:hypothetical protein
MTTTQVKSGNYSLDIRGFDSDVAHLYEHLLIVSFKQLVEQRGFSPYSYGWVSGDTFADMMYIEYGFYKSEVEELFKSFIARTKRIDMSLLDIEIERLQAEDKAVFLDSPKAEIQKQLDDLDKLHFRDNSELHEPLFLTDIPGDFRSEVFKTKRASKSFRKVAVIVGSNQLSKIEQLAFLRFSPIIQNAVDNCMQSIGAYETCSSWPITKNNEKGIWELTIHTIRRGKYTSRQITHFVESELVKLANDIEQRPTDLQAFIDGFMTVPVWDHFSTGYYRWTGIAASKKSIYEAFRPEVILPLLNKLKVTVREPSDDDLVVCN